jgi:Bacterial capsule synthesis protein PGA_cap
LAADIPDGFTLTAVGDLIITAPISQRMKRTSPDLIKILQEADVTFGNFEGSALDVPKFDGFPAALTRSKRACSGQGLARRIARRQNRAEGSARILQALRPVPQLGVLRRSRQHDWRYGACSPRGRPAWEANLERLSRKRN